MTFTAQHAERFETAEQHKLYVALANNAQEVREAQRLRYRVFVEEMGAQLECEQPASRATASTLFAATYWCVKPRHKK